MKKMPNEATTQLTTQDAIIGFIAYAVLTLIIFYLV